MTLRFETTGAGTRRALVRTTLGPDGVKSHLTSIPMDDWEERNNDPDTETGGDEWLANSAHNAKMISDTERDALTVGIGTVGPVAMDPSTGPPAKRSDDAGPTEAGDDGTPGGGSNGGGGEEAGDSGSSPTPSDSEPPSPPSTNGNGNEPGKKTDHPAPDEITPPPIPFGVSDAPVMLAVDDPLPDGAYLIMCENFDDPAPEHPWPHGPCQIIKQVHPDPVGMGTYNSLAVAILAMQAIWADSGPGELYLAMASSEPLMSCGSRRLPSMSSVRIT